jgi:hypothetical protein
VKGLTVGKGKTKKLFGHRVIKSTPKGVVIKGDTLGKAIRVAVDSHGFAREVVMSSGAQEDTPTDTPIDVPEDRPARRRPRKPKRTGRGAPRIDLDKG